MAGIYFHIPFCKKACHYCNFFFTTSPRFREKLVPALVKELDLRPKYVGNEVIHSIYFGGGTPSILPSTDIQNLIDAVYERYEVSPDVEITLEANPDDLSRDYLYALKDTEVNRLSIGIQSFYEDELRWMNRAHSAEEAENCLELCRKLNFDSFSLDLIFGVPKSTDEKWINNMKKAISFEPEHISCYALTVEEKTAYHKHIQQGKSMAPPDELTEKQFFMCHDFLTENGYEHYEISNYSKPGLRSIHNSSYWSGAKYLGIGPAAHSYDGENRAWNVSHMVKYIEGIDNGEIVLETESLSETDRYNEYVMTSIRRIEGISIPFLKLEFPQFIPYFQEACLSIPKEYISENEHKISLSKQGLIFADFVGSLLFKI